jgi:pantetheine-phosphate adenylyltransferase
MAEFDLVAMGGTFDIIHRGHLALLSKAFSISSKVIIGLTSDEMAQRKGKKIINPYKKRLETLESVIRKNFPNISYQISKLNNDFGPAVLEKGVQALVVSEETRYQGEVLNKLRTENDLPRVAIVAVHMVMAKDGNRISTTRIRNSEIDTEGNLS